jgi:hypothetical protein
MTNEWEQYLFTDPRNGDSDNDGIRDGAEDLDHDLLSNAAEIRFGSNPLVTDTDHDGTADWAEDADGNGRSNGLEQDERPVPGNLRPSLARAGADRPPSYRDGCHLQPGETTPKLCVYRLRKQPRPSWCLGTRTRRNGFRHSSRSPCAATGASSP